MIHGTVHATFMTELHIQSTQNERLKATARLRDRRHRDRLGRILIDGWREVERAVQAGVELQEVYLPTGGDLTQLQVAAIQAWERAGATVIWAAPVAYERVAFGQREQGPVAVGVTPQRSLDQLILSAEPLIAVVEGIEKPGNLGAILRSADGAGVDAVVVADPLTDLYNPNAIRASLGTLFTVPVCQASTSETAAWLRRHVQRIFVTRVDGSQPYDCQDYQSSCAIVLGSEAAGVTAAWQADAFIPIRLPMLGVADSLNVSATAAVLFYEARRQRAATLA